MERIIRYQINQTTQPQTIKDFLKSRGYSSQSLIALKKFPGQIALNEEPVFINQMLHPGDCLCIHIKEEASSEKIQPVNLPLSIVYEDDDFMVINKPAGMPTHPSQNNYDNTLANALARYFKEKEIPFVFRSINRLDKDTSGLCVIAKHSISAGILSDGGITVKEYLGIVKGNVPEKQGTIDAPIARKEGSVIEREVNFKNGERAITHYEVIDQKNGYSLLLLRLETGRTHQIRVHLKYLGYPLIGDYLYNPDFSMISRHALHCTRLCLTHPITKEKMEFTAPLPQDMSSVLS